MYYPKSQIKTNLYTNGDEYVIELTQTPYIGYYYLTSTGKAFTGKTPDDRPNQELIKVEPVVKDEVDSSTVVRNSTATILSSHNPGAIESVTSLDYNAAINYAQLKNINIYNPPVKLLPYYNPTLPTSQNYQIGEFQRYFCKQTNQISYIEINQEQFDKLVAKDPQIEFSLYQPFTITWILTGDKEQVRKTNRNIVELASFRQKLPKFGEYLKFDYIKYYQ
jgi:hypothetical protein